MLQIKVNHNRRGKGTEFNDDCGVLDTKTTSTKLNHFIMCAGKLEFVMKKVACMEKSEGNICAH